MRRALFLLLCAAVCAAPRASAEGPDFAKLERTALEELEQTKTPGAAIAIVSNGRVVYSKGLGVTSVETRAPVTPETLFRLGSTTKMFNGIALATLADRGKLLLNLPISNVVKGLDPSVGRVTAAQLLSHTAGFRDFAAPAVSNDESAFAPAIKTFKGDVFFTEPGKIYSYSSADYWLAGVVLEEVTGRPYADAMAETVFAPIGMERTTFRPLVAMTYPMAVGHDVAEGRGPAVIRPAANNTVMWPGGSIYSNVLELARFATAMVDGGKIDGKQAIPASAVEAVESRRVEIPGSDQSAFYCFGLINAEDRGVWIFQHGGFSRGYGSMMVLVPAQRFAVIVVTNRSGSTLPRTVTAATEMFLPFEKEEEGGVAGPVLQPMGDELTPYVGVYEHAPSKWEVFVKDGKLFLRSEGAEHQLVRVGAKRFSVSGQEGEEIVFVPSPGGRFDHIFLGLYSARRVS